MLSTATPKWLAATGARRLRKVPQAANTAAPFKSDPLEAAALSAGIEDPDLREAVRRAAAASLAKARHDRVV